MSEAYRKYLRRCGCKSPLCRTTEEIAQFKKDLAELDEALKKVDIRNSLKKQKGKCLQP